MPEQHKDRVRHFDAGVQAVVEANSIDVSPDTKSEGMVTVVMLTTFVLSIIFCILGLLSHGDFFWASGLCVVIYTGCAIKLGRTAKRQLSEMREHRAELIRAKRKEYAQESTVQAFYVMRHLEPNRSGPGEIVHTLSRCNATIKELRKDFPEVFEKPGFYTLMRATGDTLTIGKGKS